MFQKCLRKQLLLFLLLVALRLELSVSAEAQPLERLSKLYDDHVLR